MSVKWKAMRGGEAGPRGIIPRKKGNIGAGGRGCRCRRPSEGSGGRGGASPPSAAKELYNCVPSKVF